MPSDISNALGWKLNSELSTISGGARSDCDGAKFRRASANITDFVRKAVETQVVQSGVPPITGVPGMLGKLLN